MAPIHGVRSSPDAAARMYSSRYRAPWRPPVDSERRAISTLVAADPVGFCAVAAAMESWGLTRRRDRKISAAEGGMASSFPLERFITRFGPNDSLLYRGGVLLPLWGSTVALNELGRALGNEARYVSSIHGRADPVMDLWAGLNSQWGPAREIRDDQRLMLATSVPEFPAHPGVAPVRRENFAAFVVAAAAMYKEELGIDPLVDSAVESFYRRLRIHVQDARAWALVADDEVIYKADIALQSHHIAQLQGVWVAPHRRSEGLGSACTAAVVRTIVQSGRKASLVVNSHNTAALSMYKKLGFVDVGRYATVLID